jgi:hypothetical protein
MKKLLLTGIAALFLATGAAHAAGNPFEACSSSLGHNLTGKGYMIVECEDDFAQEIAEIVIKRFPTADVKSIWLPPKERDGQHIRFEVSEPWGFWGCRIQLKPKVRLGRCVPVHA